MKRYIAFLLAALMCTNLCACGAEQAEPEVEKTPVIEEVQEVVVPTEPVVQEVNAPKEKLSVTYMGKVVEDGGTLYVNEEAVDITIQQGRKKLKNYKVTISNPSALEYSISDNGMLNLKAVEKGTSTLILSSETAEFSLTVETGKKLSVQVEEEIIQANGAFYMNTEEKQTVTVLLDGEPITDFEVSSSKDPLPGKSSTTIANYKKDENGRILLTTAFRGTYDFTVYHKGLSETFYIGIGIGNLWESNQQNGNNQNSQAPIIQQINYDYDTATIIDYNSLQDAVDAKRKSESNGSFAGFDKYLVEAPTTNGLVSSAEIKALKSGSGNMPNSITYEQAVEDVDLLFRTMKVGYGAYYFFGEEKWEQAETEVMNWLNGQTNVSVQKLRDKLRSSTAFMRDAHSWIAKKSDSIPGFRYEYYYCTGHDFSKDENGFYKEKDGVKWYYESCDNGAVTIKPSLKQNGVLVYQPVLFSPWYAASSQITLTNGTEKKAETVVWNLSQAYTYSGTRADYKYIEESGIAYMSIRDFHEKDSLTEMVKFAQDGSNARNAKVFIIDIRSHDGGTGKYISDWFAGFTGKELIESFIKSTRYSILNGETNGTSTYHFDDRTSKKIATNNVPVIVLVDDECGSAGESMLHAVKNMTNVLVVGSNSAGYQIGSNCVDVNLPNTQIPASIGTTIRFNNQIKNVDGIGYEPDVWCNPQTALSASLNLIKQYGLADESAVSAMAKQLGVNL